MTIAMATKRPIIARLRPLLPRPEATVLLAAVLVTGGAKWMVIRGIEPANAVHSLLQTLLPDVIFFAGLAILLGLLHLTDGRRVVPRLALLIAGAALGWAILNAAWLLSTSVQLQPSVLKVLWETSSDTVRLVEGYAKARRVEIVPLVLLAIGGGGWILWRLLRPVAMTDRRMMLRRCGWLAIVLIAATTAHAVVQRDTGRDYASQVLGFSSHWYAVRHLSPWRPALSDVDAPQRVLARVGERTVGLPDVSRHELPNVLVILLESVPYDSTLAETALWPGAGRQPRMPALQRLRSEGVEFVSTHVPIPQTTKAFWAAFTGSDPEAGPGYVESIIADEPYESIASILRRAGYRSAFFQMSTGTFECLPMIFANLDFDWAWFFENLEDESARLSPLTGDDLRMIKPMFDWVESGEQPFLLTTITSVAHDPFLVPEWFDANQSDDRYERFVRTLEFTDHFLAKMLEELDRRDMAENTIVVVMGDHGESFRPDARRGRWVPFEQVIRVPWLMRWPGRLTAGEQLDWPSSQLDMTPTLLSLIGFDISEAGFDGRNALEPGEANRRIYFASWFRNSPIGFHEGNRKVMYWPTIDTVFEYDLAIDPGETAPRTLRDPEREGLIKAVRQWQARTQFDVPARRFRERLVYDHWRVFSSGRTGRSYYAPLDASRRAVPPPAGESNDEHTRTAN